MVSVDQVETGGKPFWLWQRIFIIRLLYLQTIRTSVLFQSLPTYGFLWRTQYRNE